MFSVRRRVWDAPVLPSSHVAIIPTASRLLATSVCFVENPFYAFSLNAASMGDTYANGLNSLPSGPTHYSLAYMTKTSQHFIHTTDILFVFCTRFIKLTLVDWSVSRTGSSHDCATRANNLETDATPVLSFQTSAT